MKIEVGHLSSQPPSSQYPDSMGYSMVGGQCRTEGTVLKGSAEGFCIGCLLGSKPLAMGAGRTKGGGVTYVEQMTKNTKIYKNTCTHSRTPYQIQS